MEERDARAAKRFRRHFSLVTEMYSETLWPALKIYDIVRAILHDQHITLILVHAVHPLPASGRYIFGSHNL